jgi:hypothetical protein
LTNIPKLNSNLKEAKYSEGRDDGEGSEYGVVMEKTGNNFLTFSSFFSFLCIGYTEREKKKEISK